jgi:tape measure domain-containing protein
MATTINELITKYDLDASGFVRGARQVKSESAEMGRAVDKAKSSKSGLASGMADVGAQMGGSVGYIRQAASALLSYAQAAGMVYIAAGGIGFALGQKAAEFDALKQSLLAVEGSAQATADAMAELKESAKMPGLDFREALQGYRGLRMADVGREDAQNMIREFGNVNALSGGGADELNRILLALRQIASRDFLSGEELNQLDEAGVPARRLLRDAFGTADSEELKRAGITAAQVLSTLTAELAKLPRMEGGAKNTYENAKAALDQALIDVGTGINSGLLPIITNVTDALEKMSKDGSAEALGKAFVSLFPAELMSNGEEAADAIIALAQEAYVAANFMNALNMGMLDFAKGLGVILSGMGVAGGFANRRIKEYAELAESFRNSFQTDIETEKNRKKHEEEQEKKNRDPFSDALNTLGNVNPKPPKPDDMPTDTRYLAQIAENTAATARALERQILGGSEIGKSLTPAEIAALLSNARAPVVSHMHGNSLERAFTDYARQNR